MKKTFLVLIAALAAASSIQATEVAQPRQTTQYVLTQERIDYMAARLGAVAAKEISKSAPKTERKATVANDNRTIASVQRSAPAAKVETSS